MIVHHPFHVYGRANGSRIRSATTDDVRHATNRVGEWEPPDDFALGVNPAAEAEYLDEIDRRTRARRAWRARRAQGNAP